MAKRRRKTTITKRRKKSASPKARRARSRSGFAPTGSIGAMILTSAALRAASGLAYFGLKSYAGIDTPKVKIIVPGLIAFANQKKWIPFKLEGLTPMAVSSATNAAIENTKFLKDIFDFKMLGGGARPTAGLTPRTAAETARLLSGFTYSRNGLTASTTPKPFMRGQYFLPDDVTRRGQLQMQDLTARGKMLFRKNGMVNPNEYTRD
jgi:hypothetical protein